MIASGPPRQDRFARAAEAAAAADMQLAAAAADMQLAINEVIDMQLATATANSFAAANNGLVYGSAPTAVKEGVARPGHAIAKAVQPKVEKVEKVEKAEEKPKPRSYPKPRIRQRWTAVSQRAPRAPHQAVRAA